MRKSPILAASARSVLVGSTVLASCLTSALAQEGSLRQLNAMGGPANPSFLVDLDQDGRDDLIGGRPSVWARSEPDSGFSAPRKLTDGSHFVVAEPADADGDGDLDLLAIAGTQLFLMRNDGQMNFQPEGLPIQVSPFGYDFVFDDFDGDGVPDILVNRRSSLDFYKGLGAGDYGFLVSTQDFNGATLLDVADANGDGRPDLLLYQVLATGNSVRWANFSLGGGFDPGIIVATGLPQGITGGRAGDVDGAGGIDVVLAQLGDLVWYRRTLFGGHTGPIVISDTTPTAIFQLEDITGDQALDVVYAGGDGTPSYGTFVNDGAGVFTAGQTSPDTSDGRQNVLVGDFDADGDRDLIIGIPAGQERGDNLLVEATSPGIFAAPRSLQQPIGLPNTERIAHGDVNGDGAKDLVVSDILDEQAGLRWLEGKGNGEFLATRTLDITGIGNGILTVTALVADFNGDGFDDIAAATNNHNGISREIRIYDGSPTGPATGRPAGTLPSNAALSRSKALDVDQDGDLDLVCLGDELIWFENDGQGLFGAPSTIAASAFSFSAVRQKIDIADFDQDGIQDVLIQGTALFGLNSEARLFRGLPSGEFAASIDLTTTNPLTNFVAIAPADTDQDGDLDLVYFAGSVPQMTVTARENLGSLLFAPEEALFVIDQPAAVGEDITPVDWDMDGDIDFVFPGRDSSPSGPGGVDWVESFGGQSFAPRAVLALARADVRALTIVDLDGNLVPDLVGAEVGLRTLAGLLNERTVGNVYCASTANSTGSVASLTATGSSVVDLNALQLTATEMPPGVFGFFLGATAPDQVPGAGGTSGVLCLGGQIGRYSRPFEIRNSGPAGSISLNLDLGDLRTPTGSTMGAAGQTWYFQAWFRDADPTPTSNLTSALAVTLR